MTSMEEFRMHINDLTGTIPAEESVWTLPKLELFSVGQHLTGTIPSTIGLSTSLVELYLHNNTLTGKDSLVRFLIRCKDTPHIVSQHVFVRTDTHRARLIGKSSHAGIVGEQVDLDTP